MNSIAEALAAVLWPDLCTVCSRPLVKGEKGICLACMADMPLTDYHTRPLLNPMHERTMCHAPILRAAAMFHYERRSPYAALIHEAKYYGRPSVGRHLARIYATTLLPAGFFSGVDLIQPVPVSTLRLIRRGYNQSHHIAMGLSDVTSIAVGGVLRASRHTSQTHMDAHQRLANVRGIYHVDPRASLTFSHVLLVDDILTTGATLCACAEAIHAAHPSATISVLTLAAARLA